MARRGPKTKPSPHVPGWSPPPNLSGDALAAWAHVVGLLTAAGELGRTDPVLAEAYAINLALLRAAHKAIETDGPTIKNRLGTTVPHPAAGIIANATARLKSIATALKLSPSTSRRSPSLPGSGGPSKWNGILGRIGPEEDDKWDSLGLVRD